MIQQNTSDDADRFVQIPKEMRILPVRYLHKPGAVSESGEYARAIGRRALVSGGERALASLDPGLRHSLAAAKVSVHFHTFKGECSEANIDQIVDAAHDAQADLLLAAGGGKSLDAAKAAAHLLGRPIVCIPTVAATCAATSPASIIYDSHGRYVRSLYFASVPELVLVEPRVIAESPAEYLASGAIDAVAKWYELKAVFEAMVAPEMGIRAAMELARLVKDIVHESAAEAMADAGADRPGDALVRLVDSSIYLTGVSKCFGLLTLASALAHAVNNALSEHPRAHQTLHGFKVGYGLAVQLSLEAKETELSDVLRLFSDLRFTPSFTALGLPDSSDLRRQVAERSIESIESNKLPFSITAGRMVEHMDRIDALAGSGKPATDA